MFAIFVHTVHGTMFLTTCATFQTTSILWSSSVQSPAVPVTPVQ